METLILYRSKNGATEQYAKWIEEKIPNSTSKDIQALKKLPKTELDKYDKIIIGSGTYAGRISAEKFLKENWELLKHKPIYLFVVGLFPQDSEMSKKTYELLPLEIREHVKYRKLPGRVNKKKLSFVEKVMVRMVSSKYKIEVSDKLDKKNLTPFLELLKA